VEVMASNIDRAFKYDNSAMIAQPFIMKKARPVWLDGLEFEKNIFAGFRTVVGRAKDTTKICIAASSLYRLSINGEFICHGPARAAHNFYRVDEIDITAALVQEMNVVAIEVVGYNINSFYILNQPSFLQAEISSGDEVIAATSAGPNADFFALRLDYKLQKTQRYSFQRCFSEVYSLAPGYDSWKSNTSFLNPGNNLRLCEDKNLITRRVPLPVFEVLKPAILRSTGVVSRQKEIAKIVKDRCLTDINDQLLGFEEQELECIPSIELQYYKVTESVRNDLESDNAQFKIGINEYATFEFIRNSSGFICGTIDCSKKSTVYFVFDEVLTNGDVDFLRLDCVNIIVLEMMPGTYKFESFEPYTMKYLKVLVTEGACTLNSVALREFKSIIPPKAHLNCEDMPLKSLYDACIETFRQNAIDLYTDCPSRERAGWLCDSFFSSRLAYDIMGNVDLETNFLENYAIAESFPKLTDGALPMCYPADHYDGVFIPNWPLWMILELKEYIDRGGSSELVKKLRPRLFRYIDFLANYENADGLLENLPGWIFVEWSKTNDFVKDVNYPTNMLYAAALKCLGMIYSDSDLIRRADKLKAIIHHQSFDGKYFVDNAIRENGALQRTSNCSETCQYYAFYFEIALPKSHSQLWSEIVNKFGPNRNVPGVHPANAFIGFYLRLDLLLRYGLTSQMSKEISEYFMPMVQCTGTVWEHKDQRASCCHGFASYIAYLLHKA